MGSGDLESSALIDEVRALLRRGAVNEAEVRVAHRVARAPENADGWYLRGVIANRRRDHSAAIDALRRALAIRPDAALAWLALGTAFARSNAPSEAANAYRRALEHEPAWADAHLNLGLVLKQLGDRVGAIRALHAAWVRDPMLFDAAKQCVGAIAEHVRRADAQQASPARVATAARPSFTVVVCSIDASKCERAVALYRRLLDGFPHDIVAIRNPRSLAEAYNDAARASRAQLIVMSHDDVDVLAGDFSSRVAELLTTKFDVVGVVGSTRMDGPAIGWSGHPHLRGWITHRVPGDSAWRVDVLHPSPVADGIAMLDGVILAARRDVLSAVPFDSRTFDGFHLYDLDWGYRAAQAGFRLGVVGELILVHASRGNYGATWERYAARFCAKHDAGRVAAAASTFFGATLESADQVRAFFCMLGELSRAAA